MFEVGINFFAFVCTMASTLKPISLTALAKDSTRWFTINSTPLARWDTQAATLRGSLPTLGQPSGVFIDMVVPAQFFTIRNLPTGLQLTQQAIEFTFGFGDRIYVIISPMVRVEYDAGPPADFKIQVWGEAKVVTPPYI